MTPFGHTGIPFYRKSSVKDNPIEDGHVINVEAGVYMVCDAVSEPHSPSHQKLVYPGNITGGQMATREIVQCFSRATIGSSLSRLLIEANEAISSNHAAKIGILSPDKAVAGACVAACKIGADYAEIIVAGDCCIVFEDDHGIHAVSNFDQAAFDLEQKGDTVFAACLDLSGANRGVAWDLYFPYFSVRQTFRANKRIGEGGHAILNGDPAVSHCWTAHRISLSSLQWMVLCTDGLLPSSLTNPRETVSFCTLFGHIYKGQGIQGIVTWRDELGSQAHIGAAAWPEATAVEVLPVA